MSQSGGHRSWYSTYHQSMVVGGRSVADDAGNVEPAEDDDNNNDVINGDVFLPEEKTVAMTTAQSPEMSHGADDERMTSPLQSPPRLNGSVTSDVSYDVGSYREPERRLTPSRAHWASVNDDDYEAFRPRHLSQVEHRDVQQQQRGDVITMMMSRDRRQRAQSAREFISSGSSEQYCKTCGGRLYEMEKIVADRNMYHRHCFRCVQCNRVLSLANYIAVEGQPYCNNHFRDLLTGKPQKADDVIEVTKSEPVRSSSSPSKPDVESEPFTDLQSIKWRFEQQQQQLIHAAEAPALPVTSPPPSPVKRSATSKDEKSPVMHNHKSHDDNQSPGDGELMNNHEQLVVIADREEKDKLAPAARNDERQVRFSTELIEVSELSSTYRELRASPTNFADHQTDDTDVFEPAVNDKWERVADSDEDIMDPTEDDEDDELEMHDHFVDTFAKFRQLELGLSESPDFEGLKPVRKITPPREMDPPPIIVQSPPTPQTTPDHDHQKSAKPELEKAPKSKSPDKEKDSLEAAATVDTKASDKHAVSEINVEKSNDKGEKGKAGKGHEGLPTPKDDTKKKKEVGERPLKDEPLISFEDADALKTNHSVPAQDKSHQTGEVGRKADEKSEKSGQVGASSMSADRELPEPGLTRSLMSMWKSKEDPPAGKTTADVKDPKSPGTRKEDTKESATKSAKGEVKTKKNDNDERPPKDQRVMNVMDADKPEKKQSVPAQEKADRTEGKGEEREQEKSETSGKEGASPKSVEDDLPAPGHTKSLMSVWKSKDDPPPGGKLSGEVMDAAQKKSDAATAVHRKSDPGPRLRPVRMSDDNLERLQELSSTPRSSKQRSMSASAKSVRWSDLRRGSQSRYLPTSLAFTRNRLAKFRHLEAINLERPLGPIKPKNYKWGVRETSLLLRPVPTPSPSSAPAAPTLAVASPSAIKPHQSAPVHNDPDEDVSPSGDVMRAALERFRSMEDASLPPPAPRSPHHSNVAGVHVQGDSSSAMAPGSADDLLSGNFIPDYF